jgi:hypothetical protein
MSLDNIPRSDTVDLDEGRGEGGRLLDSPVEFAKAKRLSGGELVGDDHPKPVPCGGASEDDLIIRANFVSHD